MIQPANRLCVYFFFDRDGRVDRYVTYLLRQLRPSFGRIIVVCGFPPDDAARSALSEVSDSLLVQGVGDNPVAGYQIAVEFLDASVLSKFDQAIFLDHTLMGPIIPLEPILCEMAQSHLWGLWEDSAPHFIGLGKATLRASDKAYDWAGYFACKKLECTVRLLEQIPLVRRGIFCGDYGPLLETSVGRQGREQMRRLEQSGYDVEMVWEHILRTANMADIRKCLTLDRVLPVGYSRQLVPEKKIALVMHLYYSDLFQWCYDYALFMPPGSDLFITINGAEKKRELQRLFLDGPWGNGVTFLDVPNVGRDVAALLISAKEIVGKYEYVCFVHDKKSTHSKPAVGVDFAYHCFENLLGSSQYVENVIDLFEREPRLGILSPPPPYHAHYYGTIGGEWGSNYRQAKELAEMLGIAVDISPNKEPIAPYGTMFWFRPKALEPLLTYSWKQSDFPAEPIETDGTILHVIERLYPFAAQQQGYYSTWCVTDRYAELYLVNNYHMLSRLNSQAFRWFGVSGGALLCRTMEHYVDDSLSPQEAGKILKIFLKGKVPPPVWRFLRNMLHRRKSRKARRRNV